MVRLNLATDRLVNVSHREGSSRPTIRPAFLVTRFTRLFWSWVLLPPDWKREAQHAFCDSPVEVYQDLTP